MAGLNKVVNTYEEALAGISNDMLLMVGGFGLCGIPEGLIQKVADSGVTGLTCISNNAGVDGFGLGKLLEKRQVKTMSYLIKIYVKLDLEYRRKYYEFIRKH